MSVIVERAMEEVRFLYYLKQSYRFPCLMCSALLFLSVFPTLAFLGKLCMCPLTWFCEPVMVQHLKPVQYTDISKRSLAFSEFSLWLSLWSCCMMGKNSEQTFPTVIKIKFSLARRKLPYRQKQMQYKFILPFFNLSTFFCFQPFHIPEADLWSSWSHMVINLSSLLPQVDLNFGLSGHGEKSLAEISEINNFIDYHFWMCFPFWKGL